MDPIEIPGLDLNSFLRFAKNTQDTQAAFDMQKGLIQSPHRAESIQWLSQSVLDNQEFMKLFRAKYIKRFPTLSELQAMPEGSLGSELAKHLVRNQIQLDFAGIDVEVFYRQEMTPQVYLGLRALRNHDVLHTLLGRDVSSFSEYYLLAFQIAQFQSPLHVMNIASGMLNTILVDIQSPRELIETISAGFEAGKKAQFVFGFPLEDHWETPIEEVRSRLDICVPEEDLKKRALSDDSLTQALNS